MRVRPAVRTLAVAATLALVPATAYAATSQPGVVAESAPTTLPQLVASTAVPAPHVDAIATGAGTTYAAGLFDTMTQGGTTHGGLSNIAAFDSSTGAFSPTFSASISGQVWDLELDAANNALYVAGDFSTVNGTTRSGLAKLDATTGALITKFAPRAGKVQDISLVTMGATTHLFVGGPNKLTSLDPIGGKADGYTFPAVTQAIPGAWGVVGVYRFAVNQDHTRMVFTGNFQQVGTESRTRLAVLDLGPNDATVDPWYYKPFSKPCTSSAARRIAYLQGVDWSPTGDAFDVTATGQISKNQTEVWHPWLTDAQKSGTTVCDAVGRFNMSDPTKPAWINYTGGDSVWRVQDTGSAVYVSGHFQWLDNADGFASKGIGDRGGNGAPATPAARRLGIGAIDPVGGRALSWAPQAELFKQGGHALLATDTGLWIGNDSKRFGGQAHYGLAFAKLP